VFAVVRADHTFFLFHLLLFVSFRWYNNRPTETTTRSKKQEARIKQQAPAGWMVWMSDGLVGDVQRMCGV